MNLFLLAIIVVLLCLLYFTVKKLISVGSELLKYDDFYENSLEDMQQIQEIMQELNKKEIFTLDPDVQTFKRCIGSVIKILSGYLNAKKE